MKEEKLLNAMGKITRNLSLNRYHLLTAQKRGMGQAALALSELEDCIPAQNDLERHTDEMILVEAIESFLRAHPKTQRNIFVGRYWHLYSIRELAAAYRISESKTASMLHRMRSKLKFYLEQEGIFL